MPLPNYELGLQHCLQIKEFRAFEAKLPKDTVNRIYKYLHTFSWASYAGVPIGKEMYSLITATVSDRPWSAEYSPYTCMLRLLLIKYNPRYWYDSKNFVALYQQMISWHLITPETMVTLQMRSLVHMHQTKIKESHFLKTVLWTCTTPSNL